MHGYVRCSEGPSYEVGSEMYTTKGALKAFLARSSTPNERRIVELVLLLLLVLVVITAIIRPGGQRIPEVLTIVLVIFVLFYLFDRI